MRNLFITILTIVLCLSSILKAGAEEMKSTTWSAFGVSFKVPANISIEDDSEEGYILSNDNYYINVQMLNSEGMDRKAMKKEIKQMADEDQLVEQTPVSIFDLAHFYGMQLQGKNAGEFYLYNYLIAKDESCGLFITVIYKEKEDVVPHDIIKSFILVD